MGHQRGAPHHTKTPRGEVSARGTAHGQGTRARQRFWRATSTFWAARIVRVKRIVTRKRLIILEVTQYGHSGIFDYSYEKENFPFHLSNRIFD